MPSDPVTTRKNLIRYLGHLTVTEWPEYAFELTLPSEAKRQLHDAHVAALRYIGISLLADPVARQFVEAVNNSIPGPPYDSEETLLAARSLAPKFLKRLQEEDAQNRAEAVRDPVGQRQREYLRTWAEADPFFEDANVCVDGLTEAPENRTKIDPFDGSVVPEF